VSVDRPFTDTAPSSRVESIEAVLKGGHANGQIVTLPLPFPLAIYTWPGRLASMTETGLAAELVTVPYDFTGTARITTRGEILMVIYQARGR
jgi:hypothetical protein